MADLAFPTWPRYSQEEADRVQKILLSNKVNYWTGDQGREFEKEFAAFTNCHHAVAVANGTLALEVALRALGIAERDEVIVTPRTFIASVSAILATGAQPVFVDVDPDSQNITADTIRPALTERTRAIVTVHLAGWPCDMDAIMALAKQCNLKVIEDCAQAHGALLYGRPVGSLGHIAAWSFCQDKIITTGGEGGMVTTNDPELWARCWSYKDHGKSWQTVYNQGHGPGYRWVHETPGSNYRMTGMQAGIGRLQLLRMPEWQVARQHNAQQIQTAVQTCRGLYSPEVPQGITHAWYKFYAFLEPGQLRKNWSRDRIIQEINMLGIPCFTGTCPEVYLEKAIRDIGAGPVNRLATAKRLGETSLMFLVHPTLTEEAISRTCDVIVEVMQQAAA